MSKHWLASSAVLVLAVALACGHATPRVLTAPPQAAYKTVGMISGTGENEAAAMGHALDQGAKIGAHALIVEGQRPVGRMVIVTCRAIQYLGPPPE